MAEQVNPLGGLTPGTTQPTPAVTVTQRPTPPPPSSGAQAAASERDSVRPGSEAQGKPTPEALKAAAQRVSAFVAQSRSDVRFMVDESTGQYYFKIVDAVTHKIIRQVPSEEVLAMAQRLQELADGNQAKGVLVDAQG